MLIRFTLKVLLKFMSSWLMRSPNSVFGAISGTDKDVTVMPGSTTWPAVHLPCATHGLEAGYVVVGVISHTDPTPFGLLSCVADGCPVGPVAPPSRPESAPVPNP